MHAYFDCFSGISGDMTLGAFVDLGVPLEWLQEAIAGVLPQNNFELSVTPASKMGIGAQKVDVLVKDENTSRDYSAIKSLIMNGNMPENARKISLDIFKKVALAESKIHGCELDTVHFHEVGAVDSIVDITGAALCVDYLGIDKVFSSPLHLGKGFVNCRHGRLPVPAPATLEILKDTPICGTDIPHELVTPTGAAIIKTLSSHFGSMPEMVIQKTGYGAGHRNLDSRPNLLRVSLGTIYEETTGELDEKLVLVETCIDDMNPEFFGFLMDRLFDDNALDVYWIPIHMKKNRPGTMVHVLCSLSSKEKILRRILTETTSSGVRCYDVTRRALPRRQFDVETSYGKVQVKEITRPDGSISIVPEFDNCKTIALEKDIPVKMVYETIQKEAGESKNKQ